MSNDAGLISLGGYAYQIKVFISLLPKLNENSQLCFEKIDDISISEKNIDSASGLSTTMNDMIENSCTAIQVKKKALNATDQKKIMLNWLIIAKRYNTVTKYILYYDSGLNPSFNSFSITVNELMNYIKTSKHSKPNSLIQQVKNIYPNLADIEKDFNYIIQNCSFKTIDNIEDELFNAYNVLFHYSQAMRYVYSLRLGEICRIIQQEILSSAETKSSYSLSQPEFHCMVEEICQRVTAEEYKPDYAEFVKELVYDQSMISSSREFRQLKKCNLQPSRIKIYISNQMYYNDYRFRLLQLSKASKIEALEITAYENYGLAIDYLNATNNDSPAMRLHETIKRQNTHAFDSQISNGAYIHLTEDGIEKEKQISWSDEIEQD